MRRADRLFRIVELLKTRRYAVTAQQMAELLEVSKRTIYRDIMDLSLSGVPIIGEAGVGYMLDESYVVRPLMFSLEELDALMLGIQMVRSWTDSALADAATSALDKIGAVLPLPLRNDMMSAALFAPQTGYSEGIDVDFAEIRQSIRTKNYISFRYQSLDNRITQRHVRPLAIAFFASSCLLMGWCSTRHDFRNFRLDRMSNLLVLDEVFRDEDGKRLSDFEEQQKTQTF